MARPLLIARRMMRTAPLAACLLSLSASLVACVGDEPGEDLDPAILIQQPRAVAGLRAALACLGAAPAGLAWRSASTQNAAIAMLGARVSLLMWRARHIC